MMKKGIIIPLALFVAVFCVSFFCQRYTLIFREYVGLFLFTPDYLRETFAGPWPLSNLVGSFLGQFYGEPVLGAMIPAAMVTVIYLCLNAFLRRCRVPFHRLFATVMALTVWVLTTSTKTTVAITAAMLISIALWLLSFILLRIVPQVEKPAVWWEFLTVAVLLAGSAIFVSQRKETIINEELARVIVNTDEGKWSEVLKVATPEKVVECNLMMPYAMLALNNQVALSESMFRYPVTGLECMDLEGQNNLISDTFQSYLFESLGFPNEAIHQVFQFNTNFPHALTHLSLRRLIKLNVAAGHYKLVVKYAEILSHNLYYRPQAKRIIRKYDAMEDTAASTTPSSVAPVFSYDPSYDIVNFVKMGNNTPVVMDRFMAYCLIERNLDDFVTMFYSYNWNGVRIPRHYQEALLLAGDIRDGIKIDPAVRQACLANVKGTYQRYYFGKRE